MGDESIRKRLKRAKNKNEIRQDFFLETGIDEIGLMLLEYSDIDEDGLTEIDLLKPVNKKKKIKKCHRRQFDHQENNKILSAICKKRQNTVRIFLVFVLKAKIFIILS